MNDRSTYDPTMNENLAAAIQQAPWWQSPVASLVGALVALFGVWLNAWLSSSREDRKTAEAEKAQQIDLEREAIADLIAAVFPWTTAVNSFYAAAWFRLHPRNRQSLMKETWDKAVHDEERFTAALWKARVTVHNPPAREALRSLTDLYKEYSAFVEDLEDTHNCQQHEPEEERIGQLTSRAEGLCNALESAALSWKGTRLP